MYIRFLWEMLAFVTFALTQGLCAGHDLRQMLRRGLDSRKVYSECMKQDRLIQNFDDGMKHSCCCPSCHRLAGQFPKKPHQGGDDQGESAHIRLLPDVD